MIFIDKKIKEILEKKDKVDMQKAYGLHFVAEKNEYQLVTLVFDVDTNHSEIKEVENVGGIEALAVRKAYEKLVRDLFKLGDK